MEHNILVAFAGKYGATAEIADRIAEVLRQAGLNVDVRDMQKTAGVADYTAVVAGSAVYMGRWRKEAAAFLKTNAQDLALRKVWLFSSGPTGKGDPTHIMGGFRFPKSLQSIADRIKPVDIAFFHGVLNPDKLNLVEKLILKGIKAPIGDFRDWTAIAHWAEHIAAALRT